MAILLCAAMTFSVLPSAAAKAEDEEKVLEVVAEYDMSHGDGKLRDISGNENDAELVGFEDSDFVEEDGDTVLCFSGNKEKYVKLPAELVEGENFTIEAQFQTEITKQNYNQWLFCLGSKVDTWPNVKNYIFFCPVQGGNNNGKDKNMRAGIKNATSEILLGQDAQIQEGYNTVKYVFEEGKVTLSVNEEEVESIETGYSIQQILNGGTDGNVSGYIGKSLYSPDPAFRGKLKSFKICAEKKDNSDEGKVAEAKEQLQLPYENVYGNITLPKKTENGAVVTWETDHPEIVDIESHKNEGYDETPAGTVTRPQKETTVTMTATLTYGNASDTKEFKFTVKKAAKKLKEEDYKGYFFSYFAGEGYADGEQIYFAASKNGLKWYDLNDNEPVLTSDQGEKGVRDPFILRSAEGDKFYMIATDLKINSGNGWGAAQTSGSQSLMVWESTDLVNWSDMRMVEVSASINAGCTWAPEATYDPITGEYIVYWASKVSEDNYGKQRVYYAKTRDFYTFTEPKVYIEDKTESCIDTTIIYNKEEQMYYRYTKNEGSATNSIGAKTKTIFAEKSKTLLGEWTHIPSESLNNNQWVEGPTIFQFNQQDSSNGKWCLLVDDFGGRGYYPLVTDALSTGEFSSPEIYTMPSRARHGTPIRVTEEEYNAVMQKWGKGSAQENDEEEQKAPVLSYDFENTEGSVITDISGNGNNGTMYGEAKVQKDEERNSNVLYLNGTSETFAELPQGFFDGRNTFSISMDMKAEKVDGNFFAFSIGQDSKKYLFMKPTQDAIKSVITTGSWGSENGFTEKTGTSVKDTWLHLTLIVDGIDMKLYLDDQLIGHNKNVKREIVELGKELKSYLGRSFYNGDTYFKGAFDNIKVYNRVLSDSELKGEETDSEYNAGYLWTFFDSSDGYEKIFLGYSKDGLTWEKLNKDEDGNAQPILVNDAQGSDLGVRDPHIIRSKEGDKYWILGTDLHAEGGGSGGSGWDQINASQNLVVWESTDLVNWSEPQLVYAGFDNAGCVWAPEAIYDEATDDYLVYWSSRDKSKNGTDQNALRVYVCRTKDFHTFSEPKVWLSEDQDTGNEVNIIDSTIVKSDGKFYRFSTSDWNTVIDVSNSLSEDVFDVRQGEESSENGDWKRIVKRSESSQAGFDRREGFTVYQLPDGRWCAMGDNGGYKAFLTDDLASGKFTVENANFVDGRFRHGTVIRLSEEEEKKILSAYGEDREEEPDPEQKVLAEFNFDEEGSGFESKYARATGAAYELADSYSEESGKALYLNGKEDNFLTVTDKEGKSLLTDVTELTVSYDAKTERSDTNWIMYAAPNKNTPQYQYEKYIGIMEKSGTTTVERYKNSGDRPANPSAQTGNDWNHIDVVMSKTDTTIYVNGQKVSSETSAYSLRSILGKNSILQIGKSNWGEGEYFKGWIDNFRIENRALTEEEVKELSEEFLAAQPIIKAVTIGSVPEREEALEYRGTDDHTAVFTKIDTKNKVMTPYIKDEADLTKVPVTFTFNGKVEIKVQDKTISNGTELDLSKDLKITLISNEKEEEWTIQKPILSNNPVLPGQHADPDIDYFDGKFWIFPTTDGYPGWSGTKFHAFSSKDLVNWTDEGIIMELANENPGKNENGVEIATSPWAEGGSAWAPTIEEKNGKYYFYYCGKFSNGQSAIGVAVADHPAGPYKDKGEALITVDMCKQAGIKMGQAIDPSIFTDDDGTSYITFGNGAAAIAQLSDDMMSIEKDTLKQINGLTDFRESVVVTKANGKYHWTWSCDDANSPNYHVNYGVSDTLLTDDGSASVTLVKKNLLAKDESLGILGSAHQSIVHVKDGKGQDRYFMAYHRFYTPLNIFTAGDGLGVHRETCIDEITFDKDGYMQVTPTHEGVDAVKMIPDEPEVPDTPDTPEQPENPEEPMNPEQPDTPQNDNGQMTTSKPAPTGDGTNVILLIMTMMIALGVVWRKKETKTK